MTKETQTQAIAEPFKFKNAALLNRLSEMAQVPYYATACHTLIQAEMAIVELERENATLRAEVERLAAQAAPTGLTDMGWVIDAATKGELAAYDQESAECQQAVTKILDGKDTGAGTANPPWEPLRRRLIALVAQAPVVQAGDMRSYLDFVLEPRHINGEVSAVEYEQALIELRLLRDRASSGAAQAVRMLTEDEQAAIIDMHSTGRAQGDHECAEAIQRKFCEVNKLAAPSDGEIGGA